MPRSPNAKPLTLLAAIAVLVVFAIVTWQYRREIRAWYVFRRDFERLANNEQGYPEYRQRQTGIVFVRVGHFHSALSRSPSSGNHGQ